MSTQPAPHETLVPAKHLNPDCCSFVILNHDSIGVCDASVLNLGQAQALSEKVFGHELTVEILVCSREMFVDLIQDVGDLLEKVGPANAERFWVGLCLPNKLIEPIGLHIQGDALDPIPGFHWANDKANNERMEAKWLYPISEVHKMLLSKPVHLISLTSNQPESTAA